MYLEPITPNQCDLNIAGVTCCTVWERAASTTGTTCHRSFTASSTSSVLPTAATDGVPGHQCTRHSTTTKISECLGCAVINLKLVISYANANHTTPSVPSRRPPSAASTTTIPSNPRRVAALATAAADDSTTHFVPSCRLAKFSCRSDCEFRKC